MNEGEGKKRKEEALVKERGKRIHVAKGGWLKTRQKIKRKEGGPKGWKNQRKIDRKEKEYERSRREKESARA